MFSYTDDKIFFHHTRDVHPITSGNRNESAHAHKKNEIFYFISGRADYLVEGRVYKLVPGSIMIMRSGEFHKILIQEDSPYERMALHFDSGIVASIDPDHCLLTPFTDRPLGVGNYFSPGEIRIGHIYECLKSIDAAPKNPETRRIAITANLFPILYEIKTAFDERNQSGAAATDVGTLAGEIIAYINANLSGELSLDLLSDKFYISKNHLNRIFKAATGVTVWEYVKLKRLILARNSILAGSTAIAACQSSGFNDYSAFYRAYKERFGVSPKAGEKQNRSNR